MWLLGVAGADLGMFKGGVKVANVFDIDMTSAPREVWGSSPRKKMKFGGLRVIPVAS